MATTAPSAIVGDVAALVASDGLPPAVARAVLDAVGAPPASREPEGPLRLRSLTVEGFRGVAAPVELRFDGEPGLTLVVGRTGAGKSSVVDALELVLTGEQRGPVRRSGAVPWRNRHHPHPSVVLELADHLGSVGVLRARWPDDGELAAVRVEVGGSGDGSAIVRSARRHRPVLSSRQGRVTDGAARIAEGLGADTLALAGQRLVRARDAAQRRVDDGRRAARRLADRCEAIDDPVAARAARLLRDEPWDLAALRALAADAGSPDGVSGAHRRLADATVPDPGAALAAAAELRAALAAAARADVSDPVTARRRAALLDAAAAHGDGAPGRCPVCASEALPDGWESVAREEASALRREAFLAEGAHRRREAAIGAARAQLVGPPVDARELAELGPEVVDALGRWASWASDPGDALALAGRLAAVATVLEDAVGAQRAAAAALGASAHRWRALRRKLEGWLTNAEEVRAASEELAVLVAAETWIRSAEERILQGSRTAVEERSRQLWELLGQRTDLPLPLPGGAGAPGAGVLSRGERHALALSLFLPRASLPVSPFGFVVIDDAAEGFDAERIDVLARVLAETAATHQVVAFTRDERLALALGDRVAVRRIELERRGGAAVAVRAGGGCRG